MIFPDNIPLNPLKNGQLWISHYPGKRDIENKAIQAEMDLLELKKRKIDIVASLLERKELAELQIANLFELIKKHNFSHYYFPIKTSLYQKIKSNYVAFLIICVMKFRKIKRSSYIVMLV